jgi:A/G-specific adenine glycosylase
VTPTPDAAPLDTPILAPSGIMELRRCLLAWYDARARDLPWREDTDPYRVWVSEVMLQQTRVEAVIPYYLRWMERFPSVERLAAAPEEEVMGAWAGLGYYSRARNLHRAAREVRERHGGVLPSDPEALRALPGVGEYTVGAVGSIAFGLPLPAVDGNVRRVLARLGDEPDPTPAVLRRWAVALVDPERPGDFNQALMELGATVCTPRNPLCGECPLYSMCRARAAGTQAERPVPRRKGAVRELSWGVAVLVAGSGEEARVLLRRRPSSGLLGGMWEFPSEEVGEEGEQEAAWRAAGGYVGARGEGEGRGASLDPVPHLFSHIRATYHPVLWRVDREPPGDGEPTVDGDPAGGRGSADGDGGPDSLRWIRLQGEPPPPLPVAQQRILEQARGWVANGG